MACVESDFSMMHDDEGSDLDFSDSENLAPVSKKNPSSKGLSVVSANIPKNSSNNTSGKTIENQYRKLTQREHCLVRPDTYIGSVEPITDTMFVLDATTDRIVSREITYTPGLYKIFDEIVVNAADNKQRDQNMDKLDIVVDKDANTISVRNNGSGIPVVMHQEHKIYVPTLIFGHLLTGSNFDDDEKKTTGGRNGYGAKLTNIFSTRFVVECLDSGRGLKFTQIFENNMEVANEPVIKKATASELKKGDYTMITFSPDLKRFKMTELDVDTVGLLSKRAYDIAGSMSNRPGKKLQVSLNDKKLPIKSFQDYLKIFDGIKAPVAYEQVGDRWEVGVSATDGTPGQISFVNAICTSKGGNHVNMIAEQIATHLQGTIKKKNKGGAAVKPTQIKNHLCIFVNCLVDNPVFDSQTKEFLSLQKKSFGSTCKLSDKFMKLVDKSEIVETIMSFAKFKEQRELKKQGGTKAKKITGIAKLDDANFAGTAKSKDCTLIITEGDSAKSLAMSGLSVVGRDYYGCFPLKGKPLNVRDATHAQVINNDEFKNVLDIMGLKIGMKYDETNVKTLRYGHLMIMADQDHDGSHIKGLVINMIHKFWPSLLDVPGFLQQFITPIVKVSKGRQSKTFFTLPQYEQWRESTGDNAKGWKIKYYKGLGTSTSQEAKEYFSNLDLHEISFTTLSSDVVKSSMDMDDVHPDQNISSSGADLIDMVFSKTRVADRKTWLNSIEKGTFLDYAEAKAAEGVRYSDFVNKELILFSQSDNARSIPHVLDGFKPSQRKVIFSCFKRKLKDEIKVAQLAGYISEHSAYHHGEASLYGTIIGMAQSFCGSNNINLLTPSGQFGTRRMGGKDAASPRYVFTKLEQITRAIFHPDDDELLNYLSDDGVSIEPEYYMPVIPMVLVNGSDGIGTGYSSSINNHDPRAIIANLRHLINGEALEPMKPHYGGFVGDIEATDASGTKFDVRGRIERTNDTTLVITELPVRVWTQTYKEFLEKMMQPDEKKKTEPEIKDFMENHTDATVSFTVTADKAKIDEWENMPKGGLFAKFKLNGSLTNSNMTLFDPESRIIRYESPEDILKEFFTYRMDYYVKRKALLVQKLEREQRMLSNKARFVREVCDGKLVVSNRKKVALLEDLQNRGYELFDKNDTGEDADEDEDVSTSTLSKGYEYLLGMKIWSLTYEKAEDLRRQLQERTKELHDLQATSPSQIWLNDLDNIDKALDTREDEYASFEADEKLAQNKSKKAQAKKAKKAAVTNNKKGKKKDTWDSDLESDSDEDDAGLSDDEVQVVKKTTAPQRKPAATPAVVKQVKKTLVKTTAPPAPEPKKAEEPYVDEIELTLAERMAKLLSPSKTASAKLPFISTLSTSISALDDARGTKRPSPQNEAASKVASKPGTKRIKAVATKKVPTTRKAPVKKAPAKKPAPPKNTYDSESEDDFDVDGSESEVEEISAPVPPRVGRTARAASKKIVYDISDGEEGSDSDFE